MNKIENGVLVAMPDAEVAAWNADVAARMALPVAKVISKADIFRRMTDAEAATFATVKAQQSLRLQLLFDGASELHSGAAEWPLLVALFEGTYGQARAAVLLA